MMPLFHLSLSCSNSSAALNQGETSQEKALVRARMCCERGWPAQEGSTSYGTSLHWWREELGIFCFHLLQMGRSEWLLSMAVWWFQNGGARGWLSCLPGWQGFHSTRAPEAVPPRHATSRRSWPPAWAAGSWPQNRWAGVVVARARHITLPPAVLQNLTNSLGSNESCCCWRLFSHYLWFMVLVRLFSSQAVFQQCMFM